MNAVASLSRVFGCDPATLYAALEERDAWWGDAPMAERVKGEPTQRLVLSVDVAGEDTRAMLVLQEAEGGTELMVMHTRFSDGATRDAHAALWERRLERLATLLSGR